MAATALARPFTCALENLQTPKRKVAVRERPRWARIVDRGRAGMLGLAGDAVLASDR
jgi:hypothetical protein